MKTISIFALTLLIGLLTLTNAKAEIDLIPIDSEIITEPEQSFEQRMDEKVDQLLLKVHAGELREALALSRQLQTVISFELRKSGEENPSECERERRCERKELR